MIFELVGNFIPVIFLTMNYEPLTINRFQSGAVAQLGERLVRNEKVGGSNPLCSSESPSGIRW